MRPSRCLDGETCLYGLSQRLPCGIFQPRVALVDCLEERTPIGLLGTAFYSRIGVGSSGSSGWLVDRLDTHSGLLSTRLSHSSGCPDLADRNVGIRGSATFQNPVAGSRS